MTSSHVTAAASRRSIAALPAAIVRYWLFVFPAATRALRGWRERAGAIPDPVLRAHALAKLADERGSAEGAAAFAILAGPGRRRAVARACVAFEVLYDYLDALTEDHPTLANNRQLHRAVLDAVDVHVPARDDYYRHHPQRDDGGYLRALVAACRSELARLPGLTVVTAELVAAAARAAEAQSLNHASMRSGHAPLVAWARAAGSAGHGLRWFEYAAGAGSPLGLLALIAAGARPSVTDAQAHAIAAAYFPPVGTLNWLLESVVDRADDERSGNHSYVGHYRSTDEAVARMVALTRMSAADLARLPQGSLHLLLLAGMVALSFQHEATAHADRDVAAAAVFAAVGPAIGPFRAMLRLRHGIARPAREDDVTRRAHAATG